MYFSFILWICFLTGNGILSDNVDDIHCDFYPCIDSHLTIPIVNSTFIKCIKRSHCAVSGNNISHFAVSQKSLFHVNFQSITVKQKDDYFLVQLRLSSELSVDFLKEGHQTSLILKISFGEGTACYEFFIPYSFFIYFKDDFVLPCFRIPSFNRHRLKFILFTYLNDPLKNIIEINLLQAGSYFLKNATEVYRFEGNAFKTTYNFDSRNFYLILNRATDSQCFFYHNISIFESSPNNICNTHKSPVHRWVSFSKKSCVHYSRNNLTSGQHYCIYSIFKKYGDCELLYPENFNEIFFFQLLPDDIVKNNSTTEEPFCENWNYTMDVRINKGTISFECRIWCPFIKCFSAYQFCLYKLNSSTCSIDRRVQFFCHNVASGFDEMISRDFLNVPSGCYTIMVLPFINNKSIKDQTRNYSLFYVTGNEIIKEDKKDLKRTFPNEVLLAMGFCLLFGGCGLWSYSKYKLRSKIKNERDKGFPVEIQEVEDIPLLTQRIKEICIFHSHYDDSIKTEVGLLKDFLQKCAEWDVYTLNDKLSEIMKARYKWLNNILECGCSGNEGFCDSKRRIIFVISSKVLHYFDSKIPEKEIIKLSNEEIIFLDALHRITRDWKSACRHLLMIFFNEGLCYDTRFTKLEPMQVEGVNYIIPRNLVNLCMSLGCSSEEEIRQHLDAHDIKNIGS